MARFDYMRSVRPLILKLSADADAQIASAPTGAMFATDILEDADLVLRTAIGPSGVGLSPAEKGVISTLHKELDSIAARHSRGSDFWTDGGVRSSEAWERIRRVARQTLERLDELCRSASR